MSAEFTKATRESRGRSGGPVRGGQELVRKDESIRSAAACPGAGRSTPDRRRTRQSGCRRKASGEGDCVAQRLRRRVLCFRMPDGPRGQLYAGGRLAGEMRSTAARRRACPVPAGPPVRALRRPPSSGCRICRTSEAEASRPPQRTVGRRAEEKGLESGFGGTRLPNQNPLPWYPRARLEANTLALHFAAPIAEPVADSLRGQRSGRGTGVAPEPIGWGVR
jgi:hypothetical protein